VHVVDFDRYRLRLGIECRLVGTEERTRAELVRDDEMICAATEVYFVRIDDPGVDRARVAVATGVVGRSAWTAGPGRRIRGTASVSHAGKFARRGRQARRRAAATGFPCAESSLAEVDKHAAAQQRPAFRARKTAAVAGPPRLIRHRAAVLLLRARGGQSNMPGFLRGQARVPCHGGVEPGLG